MKLKEGAQRKLKAYEGNFGQAKASAWSNFAGMLANDDVRKVMDGMALAMKVEPGIAKKARSLQRVQQGYKHKGGMSSQMKEDYLATKDLVADQAGEIDALNDKITTLEAQSTPPQPDPVQVEPDEDTVPIDDLGAVTLDGL